MINLITLTDPRSPAAEAYQSLRTNLEFSSLEQPLHSILVTSADDMAGKSNAVANLAVAMALAGDRVTLVDGDLRRPQQHELFGLSNQRGLTTWLQEEIPAPLQKTQVEGLQVLVSGPPVTNPVALLSRKRMADILVELQEQADYVLVDAPPVLAVTDAAIWAGKVSGVVLLINAGSTKRDQAQRAKAILETVHARMVGAVLLNAENDVRLLPVVYRGDVVSFTAGRTARLSLSLSNPQSPHDPVGIGSTPALAAAIRRTHKRMEIPGAMRSLLRHNPVVQMYHISAGPTTGQSTDQVADQSVQHEAQSAAHMLMAVAERLRRLRAAYGAWRHFDACAYFDLTEAQTARLVQISERVTMVHVVFYADALLPSFQKSEAFWQERFRPDYLELRSHLRSGERPLEPVMWFADRSQPQMLEHWQRLVAVIRATRALLDNEIAFWAANGSSDERARWRWAWATDPAPGISAELLPSLAQTPTLTLAVDFPLPTYRQPGRRRRLAERNERGITRHRSGDF